MGMSAITASALAFVCIFGSAMLGMVLRGALPEHHMNQDSKDVIKVAMATIATLAALVLGLLVSSAKTSFDGKEREVVEGAAHLILLDRTLAAYGPETKEARNHASASRCIAAKADMAGIGWRRDSRKGDQ